MKKCFGYITLCILLTIFSGCPQNKQTLKPQPETDPLPQQTTPQMPTPKEEMPETKEKTVVDIPPEINEPNLTITKETQIEETQLETKNNAEEYYEKCDSILSHYVNDEGKVNYPGLRRKRLEIIDLLNDFKKLDPNEYNAWPKEDKIAFWVNTYNISLL
ncbi:MAG: hypothetical protein ACYST2_02695, partial [Planctomycetota bacterium]